MKPCINGGEHKLGGRGTLSWATWGTVPSFSRYCSLCKRSIYLPTPADWRERFPEFAAKNPERTARGERAVQQKPVEPTFEGGTKRTCCNCKRSFVLTSPYLYRCPTCRAGGGWMRGGTVANHRAYGGRA